MGREEEERAAREEEEEAERRLQEQQQQQQAARVQPAPPPAVPAWGSQKEDTLSLSEIQRLQDRDRKEVRGAAAAVSGGCREAGGMLSARHLS